MCFTVLFDAAYCDCARARRKFGIKIAARIAMIATTIKSSISVKPRSLRSLRVKRSEERRVGDGGRSRCPRWNSQPDGGGGRGVLVRAGDHPLIGRASGI